MSLVLKGINLTDNMTDKEVIKRAREVILFILIFFGELPASLTPL